MSSGGKGGGGSTIIGYDYYASFAGVAGYGPVEALVEFVVDAKSVWKPASPVLRTTASNPYVFDVSGRGRVYFYWGTHDQVLSDPVLTKAGRSQPPYRRRVLVVMEDFKCGFERLSVPDIQVVYRRASDQKIITGSVSVLDDGQVNPIAALAETLTNPTSGLGIPKSRLDEASWQTAATELHGERANQYLSILLDQKMRVSELLEEINGTADTWFRINDFGQIAIGRFLSGAAPPDLPAINQHDLTDPPDINAHGYAELDDRVTVSYRDRNQAYADAQVRFDTPLNRGIVEASQDAESGRPWITRADQAAAQAVSLGLRQSTPWDNLRLSVREARILALGLKAGDQFIFDYEPLNYQAVCRLLSMTGFADGGGSVKLDAETERGLGPAAFTPLVSDPPVEDEEPIEPLAYFDAIQATPELAGGQTYRIVPLAGRHQPTVRSSEIWWRRNDSVEFTLLGGIAAFAVPVELAAAYSSTVPIEDTSGALQVRERTIETPIDRITDLEAAQSAEQIADDNLLLVILSGSGYEVLTVRSIESPTGGVFPMHVNRARFATSRLSHSAGARGYILERGELSFLTSSAFEGVALSGTTAERTAWFKAAPANTSETLEVAQAPEISLELEEQVVLAVNQVATPVPSIPGGEQANGSFPLSVSISVATAGSVLRWSKSGVPNSETEGAAYTGAISVGVGETIYAKAFKSGMLPSNALIATYTEGAALNP